MKTLSNHYKEKYGCKVYKLSLDGGFTCPNRDGTLGTRGCIFCSGSGSGDFAERGCGSIETQLERAKERVGSKCKSGKYIAYFQAFTNTYAPVERLRQLYTAAMAPEDIVGLAIGTRPDCLGDDVVALLGSLNRVKPVSVELGLQTIHEPSIQYIRRGYPNEVYFDAVHRLKAAGVEAVTHIILGLPGENAEIAMATTQAAVDAGTDGVKFHLLHVLRGTDLEQDYLAGKFDVLSMEAYGSILKACISLLPEETVVHRITGDGAKKDLIAPLWSADKKRVLNYLHQILEQ
ncbi:MAG: TIGR01212 family radical SAM protein [Oscillospiraceae bacterium]|nr:TIGR01212 family radical SAM protein [Oscillospiraceae bacterium]